MSDDLFDFGFTAVTEDELEKIQEITTQAEASQASAASLQDKVDNLYNAIIPLLNNLKKNPEKDYIHWPNRLAKVEQFETFLQGIYNK